MGVTIRSKTHSIDIGYGDFWRLRVGLADLCDKELGRAYRILARPLSVRTEDLSDADRMYEEAARRVDEKIGSRRRYYFEEFLFAADCDGTATYGTCRYLLELLDTADDEEIIGYPGWKEKAPRIRDLKKILEECVETKSPLSWY